MKVEHLDALRLTPSSASTQLNLNSSMTVVSKEVRLMTSSRLLQYYFNNDLRDLK